VRSKILFVLLVALMLTSGTILAWQFFSTGNNAFLKNNQLVAESGTVFVESSWARWYPSFESLMENHDLVIVGKVVKSQLNPQNNIFTLHEVFVQEVIKDSSTEVKNGNTVTVNQFGGIWAPKVDSSPVQVEFKDSPLMKEDETSLLFLNRRDDGIYAGISPQTHFIVKDDKLFWLGAIYENRNIDISKNLQIEGTELREILSLLHQLT